MAAMSDGEAYQDLCDRIDKFIDKALEYHHCEVCSQQTELMYLAVHEAFPDEPDAICTLRERLSSRGVISETRPHGSDVYFGIRLRAECIPPGAQDHMHLNFP